MFFEQLTIREHSDENIVEAVARADRLICAQKRGQNLLDFCRQMVNDLNGKCIVFESVFHHGGFEAVLSSGGIKIEKFIAEVDTYSPEPLLYLEIPKSLYPLPDEFDEVLTPEDCPGRDEVGYMINLDMIYEWGYDKNHYWFKMVYEDSHNCPHVIFFYESTITPM